MSTPQSAPSAARIFPAITPVNQAFWDYARRGLLALPRCGACANVWYPPTSACPRCLGRSVDFQVVSGRAKLWSWTVVHRKYFSAFPPPYTVAFVELEEGPTLVSAIVGAEATELRCDMPLEAVFEPAAPDGPVLKFRVRR